MKLVFTAFLTLLAIYATAQDDYTFEMDTNEYQNLNNSISLTNGLIWYENLDAEIPIGFDFEYFGTITGNLYIQEEMATPIFLLTSPISSNSDTYTEFIIPFGADIVDKGIDIDFEDEGQTGGESIISYITIGEEGSRIFKLEYNNIGFGDLIYNEEIYTDFANFQVWLYEGTNIVEIHFGESNTNSIDFTDEQGPAVILSSDLTYYLNDDFIVDEFYHLTGVQSNPILEYVGNDNNDPLHLIGMPTDGTVYRFVPQNLGTENVAIASELEIFPNPATDFVTIKTNEPIDKVLIYATNGQLIKTLTDFQQPINIQSLAKGTYIFTIETKNHSYNEKVLVK